MNLIQTQLINLANATLSQCIAGTAENTVRNNVANELALIIDNRIKSAQITFSSVPPSDLAVGTTPVTGIAPPPSFTLAYSDFIENQYKNVLDTALSKCFSGESGDSVRTYIAQSLANIIDNRIKSVKITFNAALSVLVAAFPTPVPVVGLADDTAFTVDLTTNIVTGIKNMSVSILNKCLVGEPQEDVRIYFGEEFGTIIDNQIKAMLITLQAEATTLNAAGTPVIGQGDPTNFLITFLN